MTHFIHSFVALFVIIDPIGLAPLFISITRGKSPKCSRILERQATFVALGIMIFFAVAGQAFLKELGITLAAFRIAGGILLFVTAFGMLMSSPDPTKATITKEDHEDFHGLVVFPLAIPLIAGPGCITTIILLMSQAANNHIAYAANLLAIFLVTVVALLCMFGAERISRYLGQMGIDILARVLGIILAALSVQYIADGIRELFLS